MYYCIKGKKYDRIYFMKRVIFDVVLFLSIFLMPWWITLILAIVGHFLFKNFYEFIISGIIFYALFSFPSVRIISSPIWYSLILIILFLSIREFKKFVIFY